MVGVTKDSPIVLKNVLLNKFNGVYFPYNSYYNVQELPDTWMNIIDSVISFSFITIPPYLHTFFLETARIWKRSQGTRELRSDMLKV